MKIHQVHVRNFRNFSEASQPIGFTDETTGRTRELTVIAGSNGCGKTTVLEVMFELVKTLIDMPMVSDFCDRLKKKSYISIDIDLTDSTLWEIYSELQQVNPMPRNFRVFVGNEKTTPKPQPSFIGVSNDQSTDGFPFVSNIPGLFETINFAKLDNYFQAHNRNLINQNSGLIFFPHARWQHFAQTARIEEPTDSKDWCYRWKPTNEKSKNLAQFWVWQNYLDLEQSREGRTNLAPFVEIIETILGRNQRVIIRKGKVYIRRPQSGDEIEPHELPAGEQQILTLFGELARWLRPGAIVLIDEIESSLHPTLQRVAIYHLRNLARKYDLQVILTTHSMEVVDAVAPSEVVNLDDMVLQERGRRSPAP